MNNHRVSGAPTNGRGRIHRRIVIALVSVCFVVYAVFLQHFVSMKWTVAAQGGPHISDFYSYVSYPFNTLKNPTGLLLLHPNNPSQGGGYFHLFIADTGNNVIREFTTTTGFLDTIAGSVGTAGYADGPNALFDHPTGLAGTTTTWSECSGVHRDTCTYYDYQNLYIDDSQNYVVRKVCTGDQDPSNPGNCNYDVQTVCGNHSKGFVDGYDDSACFAQLGGITMDGSSCYISDIENHAIRVWDGSNVTTFAGNGSPGFVDGYRTTAQFNGPTKTTRDSAGNIYVTDVQNHAIRKIDSAGNVTTIAGNGHPGYADGQGSAAQFSRPTAIVYSSTCNCLYVADSNNNMIRQIDMSGNVTTYAGSTTGGLTNGSLGIAQFATPTDMVIYNGFLYISDSGNNVIRRIDIVNGQVSTFIS